MRLHIQIAVLSMAVCCGLFAASCKHTTEPAGPQHSSLSLRASFVSTRWVKLEWYADTTASRAFVLVRDGRDTVFSGMSMDTATVIDSGLVPGSRHDYLLFRLVEGKHWDSSGTLVRMLDTSRDDLVWTVKRVGSPGWLLNGIWGSSAKSVWLCGPRIVHVIGDSMAFYNPGGSQNGCYGLSDSLIWFAGENTLVDWNGHRFMDHAFNGDSLPDLTPIEFLSVWVTPDGREVFAVANNGTIVHRRADGKTWEVQPSGTTLSLRRIVGFNDRDIYVVGGENNYEGVILHFDGQSWTEMAHGYLPPPSDTTKLVGAIDDIGGASPDSLYVVGQRIYQRSRNGWRLVAEAPHNDRFVVSGGARELGVGGAWNNLWVVGSFGYVLHFDGGRWIEYPQFFNNSGTLLYKRVLAIEGEVFIVGSDEQSALLLHGK